MVVPVALTAIEQAILVYDDALRVLAWRRMVDPEDAVQAAMLMLIERPREPFRSLDHARSWLIRVCRNRQVNRMRHEYGKYGQRQWCGIDTARTISEPPPGVICFATMPEPPTPELVDTRASFDGLVRLLPTLPAMQAAALVEPTIWGVSLTDYARRTDVKLDTLFRRRRKAMDRLDAAGWVLDCA